MGKFFCNYSPLFIGERYLMTIARKSIIKKRQAVPHTAVPHPFGSAQRDGRAAQVPCRTHSAGRWQAGDSKGRLAECPRLLSPSHEPVPASLPASDGNRNYRHWTGVHKNMGHYHIFVQDNTDKDANPSVPHRITTENFSALSPVCKGHSWSLDRCMGIINISDQENIYVDDERNYIEVIPHFNKLTPVEQRYPDGRMCAGMRKTNYRWRHRYYPKWTSK